MKAITTKYLGPTYAKGSRIVATDSDNNRVTISYPDELSGEYAYRAAVLKLAEKMGWHGAMVGGWIKDGYVYVFIPVRIAVQVGEGECCPFLLPGTEYQRNMSGDIVPLTHDPAVYKTLARRT